MCKRMFTLGLGGSPSRTYHYAASDQLAITGYARQSIQSESPSRDSDLCCAFKDCCWTYRQARVLA